MLDEKDLQAIDSLIASRLGAVVEADILPKFNLLADGQKTLLEALAPKSRVEALEEEVDLLKAVVRSMSREIEDLKQAM